MKFYTKICLLFSFFGVLVSGSALASNTITNPVKTTNLLLTGYSFPAVTETNSFVKAVSNRRAKRYYRKRRYRRPYYRRYYYAYPRYYNYRYYGYPGYYYYYPYRYYPYRYRYRQNCYRACYWSYYYQTYYCQYYCN